MPGPDLTPPTVLVPIQHQPAWGQRWTRLTAFQRMALVVGVIVLVSLVTDVIGVLRQPHSGGPACSVLPCPPPGAPAPGAPEPITINPAPDSAAPPLRLAGRWISGLGPSAEYDPVEWFAKRSEATNLLLVDPAASDYYLLLLVRAASTCTPDAFIADRVAYLKTVYDEVTEDTDPNRQLLGAPMLGAVRGTAHRYVATDGLFGAQETIVLVAGSDPSSCLLAQVRSTADQIDLAFQDSDAVINNVEWGQ